MPRPHIVVICSDQHRADTAGCYGHPVCRTPQLDRLAARGVTLDRCFSQNPVCGPARASLLTGCSSHHTGVLRNGYYCTRERPSLADVLAGQGYRTAAVGKLHLSPQQAGLPEAPFYGFQHLDGVEDNSIGPYFDWACAHFPEYRDYLTGCLFNVPENPAFWAGKHDLRPDIKPARQRSVVPHEISPTCNWGYGHYSPLPAAAHKSAWITDRALDIVNEHDPAAPLFLWVGYVDPHNPFDPPAEFRQYDPAAMPPPVRSAAEVAGFPPHTRALHQSYAKFTDQDWLALRALYYGGVTFMDHHIGRLLDGLEARLDMRNTLVVYLSDHGELLGDHGLMGKQAYHYDSCIRIPTICRWDGHWPAGTRSAEIVEQTDLMATLLDAAGIPAPPQDGRSFAPLLATGALPEPRGYAYVESYHGAPEDPSQPPVTWSRTIRTDRWRVTFYADLRVGECYDLANDPGELDNRWPDPACRDVIDHHRQLLVQRLILRDLPMPPRPYNV